MLLEKRDIAKGALGYISAVQLKFLPDVIETKLVRTNGQIELCYKEYFTYLPEEVQDAIFPITLKVMEMLYNKMGIEFNLKRIKQGVEINLTGSPEFVVTHPLVEILMLGTLNMEKARNILTATLQGLSATSTGKVFRKFDDEAKKESEKALSKLRVAMQFAGVKSVEELMSNFDDKMFEMMLQQFSKSPSDE